MNNSRLQERHKSQMSCVAHYRAHLAPNRPLRMGSKPQPRSSTDRACHCTLQRFVSPKNTGCASSQACVLIHASSPAGEASSKANHATKCGLMAHCLQQPFLFKWQKCTKGSQALPIGNGNFLHCHSTKLRSSASNALIFGAGSLARAQGEPDPQRHGLQELQARHMMEKGIARLHAHRLGPRPDKSICTYTMGRVLSGANLARLRGK